MIIIRKLVDFLYEKSWDLQVLLVFSVWFGILFATDACIHPDNRGFASWMLLVLMAAVCILWAFSNKYIRFAIAVFMVVSTIAFTYGIVGNQQTASGVITNSGSNAGNSFVNIQLTEQSEASSLYAQVTRSDMKNFSHEDAVSITYRNISIFGLMDMGTVVDSIDSVPVIGAGSRNVATANALWPIGLGALPLILLTAVFINKKLSPGDELVFKQEGKLQDSRFWLELR